MAGQTLVAPRCRLRMIERGYGGGNTAGRTSNCGRDRPRGGQMNDELTQFSGHPVIDRHGTEVGTITDVVYDEMTEQPTWGVVSPGMLHARHYIPLTPPVYVSQAGAVVVPYDREDVLRAPTA